MDVDILNLFYTLLIIIVILIITICLIVYVTSTTDALMTRYEEETMYTDPSQICKKPFASLSDRGSVDLSVIIPAYEEELRLPKMLDECLDYLEKRQAEDNFTYEVIIVDDGSRDGTSKTGLEYAKQYSTEKVRILTLCKNRGKGGAVRLGMESSRGKYLLFADADGATRFSDITKLEKSIKNLAGNPEEEYAIVVGSRAHLEKESIAQRSIFRTFLMYGFHFLVWFFCVQSVRDTQCGFKLFTRAAARYCFKNLHVQRWAFDVELLYLAERAKIPIDEVAVYWTEIDGSKVVPFWSWLQMGKDLLLIWLRYRIGAWKVKSKNKDD